MNEHNVLIPTLAGVGAVGSYAVGSSVRDAARAFKERKIKSESINTLRKKIQPGDIIFTRLRKDLSPEVAGKRIPKVFGGPITGGESIRMYSGSPEYHAAMYAGKDRVVAATGDPKVKAQRLRTALSDQSAKIYRPSLASEIEKQKALDFANKSVGAKYMNEKDILKTVGKNIFLGGPKSCQRVPGKGFVCTTLVTKSYPKQFKKEWMQPREMAGVKGMDLIGRYGGRIKNLTARERIFTHGISPIIRGLKYGVPAAAATILGSHLLTKNNEA